MTPDEFRAALYLIGWTQRGLADLLRYDERTVRRWATGNRIPDDVAAWLEDLATYHQAHQPPDRR